MNDIAVRYCSKTPMGNTRRIAEAIAEGAGVKAVSIADEPKLEKNVGGWDESIDGNDQGQKECKDI